jgi:hypothetical protein
MRHDYNLFLRQAVGLFGTPISSKDEGARLTRTQLHGFMRFLGDHFLARDFLFEARGLVLILPSVKVGLVEYLGYSAGNSTVSIDFSGHVEAQLGPKDFKSLCKLLESDLLDEGCLRVEWRKWWRVHSSCIL